MKCTRVGAIGKEKIVRLAEYRLLFRLSMSFYDKLKFNADGLIPAIIQDQANGRVLMMAWMNRASLETTLATGKTHFWSRSRQKFWMKGESSGHTQAVKDIAFDCDGDTLLIQVEQIGAACHEGYRSCFFRSAGPGGSDQVTEPLLKPPGEIYGKK
jgi:phosphoribosyl-AMP cyclohydrolase